MIFRVCHEFNFGFMLLQKLLSRSLEWNVFGALSRLASPFEQTLFGECHFLWTFFWFRNIMGETTKWPFGF
jgi:hypothetical protein